MSNQQVIEVNSSSEDQTMTIGSNIGQTLTGQEVIELISDLGGGKTTFVKGLADGAGSQELVSSPSFTLCNQYQAEQLTIYHFDFYRLNDPGIIRRELAEALEVPKGVVVIEWPEVIEDILPQKRLIIEFISLTPSKRQLKLTLPETLSYLVKGLK